MSLTPDPVLRDEAVRDTEPAIQYGVIPAYLTDPDGFGIEVHSWGTALHLVTRDAC